MTALTTLNHSVTVAKYKNVSACLDNYLINLFIYLHQIGSSATETHDKIKQTIFPIAAALGYLVSQKAVGNTCKEKDLSKQH